MQMNGEIFVLFRRLL